VSLPIRLGQHILTSLVENTPNGFPRLAAFQASDANFGLYRSYSYLHSRILLDYQDEITRLETELDELDWEDHTENPERLRTNELEGGEVIADGPPARTRRTVLREIKAKLMEYGMSAAFSSTVSYTPAHTPQTKFSSKHAP
jgi:hypothetical protein